MEKKRSTNLAQNVFYLIFAVLFVHTNTHAQLHRCENQHQLHEQFDHQIETIERNICRDRRQKRFKLKNVENETKLIISTKKSKLIRIETPNCLLFSRILLYFLFDFVFKHPTFDESFFAFFVYIAELLSYIIYSLEVIFYLF